MKVISAAETNIRKDSVSYYQMFIVFKLLIGTQTQNHGRPHDSTINT
jgi:hypothetical protein